MWITFGRYRQSSSLEWADLLGEMRMNFAVVDNFFGDVILGGIVLIEIIVERLWKTVLGRFLGGIMIWCGIAGIDNFFDVRMWGEF